MNYITVRARASFRLPATVALGCLALLAGCQPAPPVSVKKDYLARRLAAVDPHAACEIGAFPKMSIYVAQNKMVLLHVWVNGKQTVGVLDTGASSSIITPELAAEAKVKQQDRTVSYSGISGGFKTHPATLDSLQVGSFSPGGGIGVQVYPFLGNHGSQIGANVGLDWLNGLDFDIDLAHGSLRPYWTRNCLEVHPPWRTLYTGLAISRGAVLDHLPAAAFLAMMQTQQISVPVAFEGGVIDGIFDSGATSSMMSHDAAIHAGATNAQLEADPVISAEGLSGTKRELYKHTFKDIAIGEEELHNFSVLVAKHFDRRDVPLILGLNFIATHHLWLSLSTGALYIDSGEPRKIEAPSDHPRWIAGSQSPAYPSDGSHAAGKVGVTCTVAADGHIDLCHVTRNSGHAVLDKAVLDWLTGDDAPVMQPAYRNGKPVSEAKEWQFNFESPS